MTAKERIGLNIVKRLQDMGKSSGWLARQTHKADDTIRRYITGMRVPTAIALYKIAEALGCSMDELMEGVFEDDALSKGDE